MPKELEDKLKKQASTHKDWSDEHKDAYVYGAMRKTGWKPKREQHGSLEDITFHENAASCEVVDDSFVHPSHKSGGYKGDDAGLESQGSVIWGALDPPAIDGSSDQFTKGAQSCNRDAGQGVHYGAPVDYFGPDTDYRAEEIDPSNYGRSYEPYPFRDYFKTDDKMEARTFRLREQDEYDEFATPGAVTDEMAHTMAYGAVKHQGAGPERELPDNRSFASQRKYARSNKDAPEYDAATDGLDTKMGKDIR